MREAHEILVAPVVTEKTTRQMDALNTYTFVVTKNANKIEIKRAVQAAWDVDVLDVRTMRYAGKLRRAMMGRMSKNRQIGRRPAYKKAVVTLAEGDSIEFYELG